MRPILPSLLLTVLPPVQAAWYNEYSGMVLDHPSGGEYNGRYMFVGNAPWPQEGNSAYELDLVSAGVRTYWGIWKNDVNQIRQKCNDAGNEGPFSYSLGTHCGCYWDTAGSSAVAFGINGTDVVHIDKCGPTTDVPTSIPTAVPTSEPTTVPTTATPTVVPTAAPTAVPTAVPTATPTAVPTTPPVVVLTLVPTATPTVEPTVVPTVAPTFVPTTAPTGAPSPNPVTPTAEPPPGMCDFIYLSNTMSCPRDSSLVGGGIIRFCKDEVCRLLASIDFSKKGNGIKGINGLDVVVQYDTNGDCVVLDYDGVWASENAICRRYVTDACSSLTKEYVGTSTDMNCVAKGGSVSESQLANCGADLCWTLDMASTRKPTDPDVIYSCDGLDLRYHSQTPSEAGETFPIICDICSTISIYTGRCPTGFQLAGIDLLRRCTNRMCDKIAVDDFMIGISSSVVKSTVSCDVVTYQKTPDVDTIFACVAAPEGSDTDFTIPFVIGTSLCFCIMGIALIVNYRRRKAVQEKNRKEMLVELRHELDELDTDPKFSLLPNNSNTIPVQGGHDEELL